MQRKKKVLNDDVILQVNDLCSAILTDVSLSLRRGEVLGLGGLHGQGQSELLLALFGAQDLNRGQIIIDEQPTRAVSPGAALRSGLAYVSGDRGRTGSLHGRPILENLSLSEISRSGRMLLSRRALALKMNEVISRLQLKFGNLNEAIGTLSGGNQQKVILGRALSTTPRILLLDDPTKGIDVHAKEDLYTLVRELCGQGTAAILYSSEDAELLENADRVLVFNSGQIVDELTGDTMTEFDLYSAALRSAA